MVLHAWDLATHHVEATVSKESTSLGNHAPDGLGRIAYFPFVFYIEGHDSRVNQ